MLIEGVDDSVLILSTIFVFLLTIIMCNYIKNTYFSVNQQNPIIHRESLNDVNQFRDQVLLNRQNESEQQNTNQRRQYSNINCPICLTNSTLPIETNCGHIFCASCIIQYWRHLTSNIFHSKMKCPMCRQLVTCLLPIYTREEQQNNINDYSEIFNQISNYNRRFSGAPRNYLDYLTDLPILLRHWFNEMITFNDLSIWYRIRFGFMIVVGLCYFISPLDIIPEALFGLFGLFDDLLVVLFLAIYICTLYRQIIANRN